MSGAFLVGAFGLTGFLAPRPPVDRLPERLADSTFWRIVSTFSEPSGYFASENFVSNETEWQYVIPDALGRIQPTSAYVGVGPEQNFTYIASFKPRIAFICDIRRQNLIEHLMYKALIENSRDRAGFLSMLWSRKRPDGIDTATSPAALLRAFDEERPDSLLYRFNIDAIFDRLVNKHRFALSAEDSATLRAVYSVFFNDGPSVSYSSSSSRRNGMPSIPGLLGGLSGTPLPLPPGTSGYISYNSNGMMTSYRYLTDSTGRTIVMRDSSGTFVIDTTFKPNLVTIAPFGSGMPSLFGSAFASFGSLMTEDDGYGVNRGWLGSEAAFQWLKDFESRNLLVPVVGDFGGPKALRAIGTYLKENDAHVSAFYTSNVEQYLFQNRINGRFYDNVAELPTDARSIFIRSFPASNVRGVLAPRRPNSRLAQTTSTIDAVISAYRSGLLNSYYDLAALQDR